MVIGIQQGRERQILIGKGNSVRINSGIVMLGSLDVRVCIEEPARTEQGDEVENSQSVSESCRSPHPVAGMLTSKTKRHWTYPPRSAQQSTYATLALPYEYNMFARVHKYRLSRERRCAAQIAGRSSSCESKNHSYYLLNHSASEAKEELHT